ncbi:MAG: DUF5010 C-terminal domain-containing protein [Prevotellaceae bacterium]|jgi:hypothetical protein|nr:DUF5010 C-terminal domain-containing protein [Prevotellaceae bacterium]
MKIKNLFLCFCGAITIFFASCEDSLKNIKPRYPVQQTRSTKRGFSFEAIYQNDVLFLSEGCVWAYNWGASTNSTAGNLFDGMEMDFCPMGWRGVNEVNLRAYVAAHPNTKYLLGTNEPNLTDQANQTPAQTAAQWQQYVDLSKELNLKLISPAMNYGTLAGYSDPVKWLDEFFRLVNPDDIHGIAIHAYMNSAGSMKTFIDRFRKYGKPIWLTEFACDFNPTPSVVSQIALMNDICSYMEADPLVERYAWFMLRGGPADVNNALMDKSSSPMPTLLGDLYNALSSQDKNIWYVENQTIEAEKYTSINCAEYVGVTGFTAVPSIRVTTDADGGGYDMTNFKPDMWLEYQIDAPGTGTYKFALRYSVAFDSKMKLFVDGVNRKTFNLNRSTDTSTSWVTLMEDLKLEKGKHTLRLEMIDGSGAINWLKFALP